MISFSVGDHVGFKGWNGETGLPYCGIGIVVDVKPSELYAIKVIGDNTKLLPDEESSFLVMHESALTRQRVN